MLIYSIFMKCYEIEFKASFPFIYIFYVFRRSTGATVVSVISEHNYTQILH